MTSQDEFPAIPEVANLLKVAENVYGSTWKGDLPGFKVGGQWRFQRADIDRRIEQQKVNARNEGRS